MEQRQTRHLWTETDSDRLRSLWRTGVDAETLACELGRPFGSVQTQLTRLGLRDVPASSNARGRIVELAEAGWASSRIAKQVDHALEAVERVILSAGLQPRTVVSYGRGRYGVDLPLPAPGAPRIVLQPVVPHPTPRPAVAERPRPVWTQEQIDLLEEMVRAGAGLRECSDALGRTVGAVHRRITDLGTRPAAVARPIRASAEVAPAAARPNGWRPAEDQALRDMTAAGERAAAIATRLGRSYSAVVKRKTVLGVVTPRLGLVRPDQWTDADIERVAILERFPTGSNGRHRPSDARFAARRFRSAATLLVGHEPKSPPCQPSIPVGKRSSRRGTFNRRHLGGGRQDRSRDRAREVAA